MRPAPERDLELKQVGLIVSAGAAVVLRCLSDFGLSTIQHDAAVANLDLSRANVGSFIALYRTTLLDALQRDWFHLSPQAPFQVIVAMGALVGLYAVLRRVLPPTNAAAAVLLVTPILPLLAIAAASVVVLMRSAHAG